MNLSKRAAFHVLKRFPSGKLCTHSTNHNFSKRFLGVRKYATLREINKDEDATVTQSNSTERDMFKQLESIQNAGWKKVEILEEIYEKSSSPMETSSVFLKAYLQTCIDNAHLDFKLDPQLFFEKAETDTELLNLLLKYSCYKGNVGNIFKVLAMMKNAGIPADESVFNLIVLGQIVHSGMKGGESALKTMRVAMIPITETTQWSILKGLCQRNDRNEFSAALKNVAYLNFNEEHFCEILYLLGVHDNHSWIQEFLDFIGKESIPRTCLKNLHNISFCLVREQKPEAAYEVYKNLEEIKIDMRFGHDLLEEMVVYKTPMEKMLKITSDLISTEKNPLALLELTEMVLRSDEKNDIWRVFSELDTLRPHYFWPIFVQQGNKCGEKGVFEVLNEMYRFKIKPDYDTLSYYLLGFCDFGNVNDLINRLDVFKEDLTIRELFNPMLYQLLSKERVKDAQEFCKKYEYPIFGERIIKQLSTVWGSTKQTEGIVYLLRRICETNPQSEDWTGKFLIKCMKLSHSTEDNDRDVLKLINLLKKSELKISSLMAEYAYATLAARFKNSEKRSDIEAALDKLLDVTKEDSNIIQHPRDMNLEELECHLIELTNKNMETRGVLRQLIQGYSRVNNFTRVNQLREMFEQNGYTESAGMKSSLFQTCVQTGNLTEASKYYKELKESFPEFIIDSFKIINFAKLMVEEGEFEKAMDLLKNEKTDIKKTSNIERNCWLLLKSVNNPTDLQKCLNILMEKGYCTPTNIILGPLIRVYLKNNDLLGAVDMYVNCTKKHRRTPLQGELLGEVLKVKDDQLLSKVINATTSVHGIESTRLGLISALAEGGFVKTLHKFLSDNPKLNNNEFRKRCERWVNEKRLEPLVTISESVKRLNEKLIDVEFVRLCIIRIYGARNDYKGAMSFMQQLENGGIEAVSPQLKRELNNLSKRCKQQEN